MERASDERRAARLSPHWVLTVIAAQELRTALPARDPGLRTYQREHFVGVGVLGGTGARRFFQRLLPQVHGGQQRRGRLRVPGCLGSRAAARISAIPRRALPAPVASLAAAPAPRVAVALHRGPGAPAPPPRRAFNRLRGGPAPLPAGRPPLAAGVLAPRPSPKC